MKLALALLALAAAAECPANSKTLVEPVASMKDCQCEAGFEAAPFPAMGCTAQTTGFVCPANSVQTTGANINNIADCKCKNGYVAFEGKCVYAYVFHVHGRAYIQGRSMDSADLTEFKNSLSSALSVSAADILPYRITETSKFTVDVAAAKIDHHRTIIAEGSSGKETGKETGMIVSFAVHKLGNSMSTGNTLVDELKSSAVVAAFDSKFTTASTTGVTKVFIWALTAQFWHPPASIAECKPNRKGDSALNHLNVEEHALDGTFAKDVCTACVQDWQCEPTECYSNGAAVAYSASALKNGDQICKVQPTCSPSNDNSGNYCFGPYSWAKKYEASANPVAITAPTQKPTLAPTEAWKRAKVQIPVDVQGVAPAELNYQARAQLLVEFASLVGVAAQDVFYVKIAPLSRSHDDATYLAANQHYSTAHHSAQATQITFGVFTYTLNEAVAVVNKVEESAFGPSLKAHISASATASTVGKVLVIPEKISAPTVLPTMAPTHVNQVPGSKGSCTEGTVMEIRGTARLQSLYNLETPLDRVMTFMDNKKTGLRKCISSNAGGETEACNVVVLNWDMKKLAIFENELTAHQHADFGTTTFSKYAWVYTFAFVLAVPGQNMHVGNDVFSKMNNQNKQFISDVNYCTSNRKNTGELLVPIQYHEGVKLSKYDEDMFNEPMIESMNMTSIELTYVARTPTSAPTSPPSFSSTDCVLSEWSGYSACDKTCGTEGKKRRWRIILAPASGGGAHCGSTGFETEDSTPCNNDVACPIDCIVGDWKDWSVCSVSCGEGIRTRTRTNTDPGAGGMACPKSTESMACREKACPVDCELSSWTDNDACTKTCGGGLMRRYRRIETVPMYGGKQCNEVAPLSASASTTGPLQEDTACNVQACPIDCSMSRWSAWGSCSKTCAGKAAGTRLFGARQERTRYITTAPSDDGVPCGALTQQRLCALHPCGAHVCTTDHGFPLTCTYEGGVVYTHHVNDVHDNELFMCYHNYVTEVCTCLCWPKSVLNKSGTETGIERVARKTIDENGKEVPSDSSDVSLFVHG